MRLVDLTRAALAEEDGDAEPRARREGPDAPASTAGVRNEPLHRIERGRDAFRVFTGWQVGGPEGGGRIIEFRRREGGDYEPIDGVGTRAS